MPPTAIELKEKRGMLVDEQTALIDLAESEDRDFSDAEKKQYAERDEKIRAYTNRIERIEALENVQRTAGDDGANTQPGRGDDLPADPQHRNQQPQVRVLPRYGRLKAFENTQQGAEDAHLSGRFILATCYGDQRSIDWCREHGVALRQYQEASTTTTNTQAGYLVPEQFMQTVIDLRETYGVFRRNAQVVPMASDTLVVPKRSAGFTTYYIGENEEVTASDKTWTQVRLTARKIGILFKLSSELSEDAIISLADDFAMEVAWSFALEEDNAGFIGDGTSTYGGQTGVVNKIDDGTHTASVVTAATGNTAFSTLDLTDFHSVVGTLPLYARANARWYISAAGFSDSMERLAYAGGGNNADSIQGGTGLRFLGYPVELVQVMNSTLTAQVNARLLLFGDLRRAAMLGDRRRITIMRSEHRFMELDQIGILATQRFHCNAHSLGDTSDAGPIVLLQAPGS